MTYIEEEVKSIKMEEAELFEKEKDVWQTLYDFAHLIIADEDRMCACGEEQYDPTFYVTRKEILIVYEKDFKLDWIERFSIADLEYDKIKEFVDMSKTLKPKKM